MPRAGTGRLFPKLTQVDVGPYIRITERNDLLRLDVVDSALVPRQYYDKMKSDRNAHSDPAAARLALSVWLITIAVAVWGWAR